MRGAHKYILGFEVRMNQHQTASSNSLHFILTCFPTMFHTCLMHTDSPRQTDVNNTFQAFAENCEKC